MHNEENCYERICAFIEKEKTNEYKNKANIIKLFCELNNDLNDLNGIEKCINLEWLNFENNSIKSIKNVDTVDCILTSTNDQYNIHPSEFLSVKKEDITDNTITPNQNNSPTNKLNNSINSSNILFSNHLTN